MACIEQALCRLENGGRLIAIAGHAMGNDVPARQDWWQDIKQRYNVRANLSIAGTNYRKYGTTWDVQLIVIDKTGATLEAVRTGEYDDITQTLSVLEGIRNDRIDKRNRDFEQISLVESDVYATTPAEGAGVVSYSGDGTRDLPDTHERNGRRGDGYPPTRGVDAERLDSDMATQPVDIRADDQSTTGMEDGVALRRRDDIRNAEGSKPERDGAAHSTVGDGGEQLSAQWMCFSARGISKEKDAEFNSDSIYARYRPRKARIDGAQSHPAELVESAAMAAVEPPDPTYLPRLQRELAADGILSEAQLENIIYAGQAHGQFLPDGARRGYYIGDGTGVGKGRQICGIILDNFNQGRTKAVWISKNKSLTDDAYRDWLDLHGNQEDILELAKLKYQDITNERGILFATYDTIKSQSRSGADHITQLKKWLGEDFDGIIVFDEAHNMANALDSKGARGIKRASAKALAGMELQDAFPLARIVYASATGAVDVKDLAYMARLGLWGRGTAFNDVHDFISKISSGGLAAMELVARDMKAMGIYMARSISFDGVRYDTLQHELTPMQREIYDAMSRAWQQVLHKTNEALHLTNASLNGRACAAARSQFFSAMQSFYNQILVSMSMPSVIKSIEQELAAGHSCVLQLVNTNQAAADRGIAAAEAEGKSLEEVDMTPSDMLIRYMENSFPVFQYEEYVDDSGNRRSRMVLDSEGKAVTNRALVQMREQLIEEIKQMKVPDGALEMLFDHFGTDQIAEVTGRTRRIVPHMNEQGQMNRIIEKRSGSHNSADVQAFQDGKKRILVFSDAGGTGKSYHADRRVKNQQERIHYLLQPGWNASSATQGFGRTHRSNQVQPPVFRLITTDIKGQKRFISTIARRLDQLGALTKGQRQTGSGIFGEKDNLESPVARDALAVFYKNLAYDRINGVEDGYSILEKMGLAEKLFENKVYTENPILVRDMQTFLNRILVLEVNQQNAVFDAYYDTFLMAYDRAVEMGNIDIGLENYHADKIEILTEDVICVDESSGAATSYVKMKAYHRTEMLSYNQAITQSGSFKGLYRTNEGTRAVYQISNKTNEDGEVMEQFKLLTPNCEKVSYYNAKTLAERARLISDAERWQSTWEQEMAGTPEYQERELHLLTGTLLNVWDKLPETNTRVVRVIANEEKQYLGRLINRAHIQDVLHNFGVINGKHSQAYSAEDVYKAVLEQGYIAQLCRDKIQFSRRRVSGENRIEITGDNTWWLIKAYAGLISEKINYQSRVFIPIGAQGVTLIEEILHSNPLRVLGQVAEQELEYDELEDDMDDGLEQ